jgi:hypothetical protein
VPEFENQDPWIIGAAGKPFFISVTLNENAVDVSPEDSAQFEASNAVFLIDGEPPTSLGDVFGIGGISFFEFPFGDDIDIVLGGVEFNGVTEDSLYTTVRLPTSTFTFTDVFELPPQFSPTPTIVGGGVTGVGSSYRTITEAGALVTATRIPEPSTFVLALLSLSVLGTRLFWREFVSR